MVDGKINEIEDADDDKVENVHEYVNDNDKGISDTVKEQMHRFDSSWEKSDVNFDSEDSANKMPMKKTERCIHDFDGESKGENKNMPLCMCTFCWHEELTLPLCQMVKRL